LFVGLGFEFDFREFVDFLLGWTTLDITGDDSARRCESRPEPPPASEPTQ
jgi:hypothetical protein